ncbi:helix-turn-helix domain-containing protein [Halomarina ordinaria]|uniref:Helix-turn-helix domain-containing protein n=1 Tax=Halomarina ordinaria TaxID=3033939 RepID=A0ABD5UC61_9EURY|nr:helix-turn-helix domain-containing protein [Halomarina sp. PSRA2]
MTTIVNARIPAEEFALHHTLSTVPEVEFETEQIVETGDDVVMPLVWARGSDTEAIRQALEEDPSTDNVDVLAEFDDELLCQMDWTGQVQLVVQMVTNSRATILNARSEGDSWEFKVLYPTRDSLSKTHDFCESQGLTFEVRSIQVMEGEPSGLYGLTDEQYEALATAFEQGYFSVPRRAELNELAADLGLSHQALSERLRRGHRALIRNTLRASPGEE